MCRLFRICLNFNLFVFFPREEIPGHIVIVFGADGDMGKMTARSRAVPVNDAGRAIDDIAGMHDLDGTA